MKDILFKFYRSLEDKFIVLSIGIKITLILLIMLLQFIFFYTLISYTDIIQKLENTEPIKTVIQYLKETPLLWIIILAIIIILISCILILSGRKVLALNVIDISILPKPDISSNLYEITLTNHTNRRILLKTIRVSWNYCEGNCCSIGEGVAINSIADYVLDIPLDVSNTGNQSMCIKMNPMIAFSAKDVYGPSYTQFRVQMHYHFSGLLKYHPMSDWDIFFSLDVLDDQNRSFNVFSNYKWRSDEEKYAVMNGELDEYNDKLKSNYE